MAKKKKQTESDFRYGTESGKVAWPAVGEAIDSSDVFDVLKFLIPPGDDKTAYRERLRDVKASVEALYRVGKPATKLTLGKQVEAVEKAARDYLGAKYACFLTNATAGFEIAEKIAGLKPGDEVIAPAITFISSIIYPLSIGAKVVLADVRSEDHESRPSRRGTKDYEEDADDRPGPRRRLSGRHASSHASGEGARLGGPRRRRPRLRRPLSRKGARHDRAFRRVQFPRGQECHLLRRGGDCW